jgi:hypothetical protein
MIHDKQQRLAHGTSELATVDNTSTQHVATGGTVFESRIIDTHGPSELATANETCKEHVATVGTDVETRAVKMGMSSVNKISQAAEVLRANKFMTREFRHMQKLLPLNGYRVPRLRPKPRHRLPSKNDLNPFFFFSSTKTYTMLVIFLSYIAIFLIYLVVTSAVSRASCLEDYMVSMPMLLL